MLANLGGYIQKGNAQCSYEDWVRTEHALQEVEVARLAPGVMRLAPDDAAVPLPLLPSTFLRRSPCHIL